MIVHSQADDDFFNRVGAPISDEAITNDIRDSFKLGDYKTIVKLKKELERRKSAEKFKKEQSSKTDKELGVYYRDFLQGIEFDHVLLLLHKRGFIHCSSDHLKHITEVNIPYTDKTIYRK